MDQKKIDQIMEEIKSDKRSAKEVFQSIADLMVKEHNIPEEKALEATRNFIGFCETIMQMAPQEDGEDF